MQHGQNLLFSNFLITISTNVVPVDHGERVALASWLRDQANNLFDDLAMLNGTVLKPANSPNDLKVIFDDDHRLERIKSVVSLEAGEQRGQMHMHVLMEVCHRYRDHTNEWGGRGVHVNVKAMRDYLNSQIHTMAISPMRLPQKIYVNSRLLTSAGNNSSKWLTLAYITKDVDRSGHNLASDRLQGTAEERSIHRAMLQPEAEFSREYERVEDDGVAIQALFGDTQQEAGRFASEEEPQQPMRFASGRRQQRRYQADDTSSYNPAEELNPNVVWNPGRRRKERREREKEKE